MIRPLALVSAGTLGSRLSGFVRDALIAALFGAGHAADAFLFAFQFINVARRFLSEGALNAALVPAYLRIRNEQGESAAASFAGRALGMIGVTLVVAAALIGLAAPYAIAALAPGLLSQPAFQLAVDTARLMLPYLAFVGPVAVVAAALNAEGRVALTAFSPVLFNLAMIAAVVAMLVVNRSNTERAALMLAAMVGIAGCLQLVFLGLSGTRHARPVRIAFDPEIRTLLCRALPGMIAQSGPQLLLVAGVVVASATPAAVAWIYFASRLVELPLGLVGTATGTVLIPRLSGAMNEDATSVAAESSLAVQLTFGLALPAAVGLAMLADPIVALLFQHGAFTANDRQATALALTLLAASLPALALTKPLGAVFFAREQMRHPVLATLFGLAATVGAAVLAQPRYGHAGVAAAISLGAWVTAIWLSVVLRATRDAVMNAAGWRNLALIVLASAIMGAAIAATVRLAPIAEAGSFLTRTAALMTLIALGVFVYATCLRLSGVVRFRAIRQAL
ncbi:murein biosynthesis integral membrane protein MurJ [Bradyrhizobium sp. LHD-71]|uniref:murein biosynthesis integral membrane protein MurJ n=1 Tax=Bradyrhizobium sp. LHD-71 TaxID=3072141 RepID=UPI00280C7751|nr:murein biosynthesis integral membrane protein MurJ [Bradyrhizobium sp. LHD-71]MDQ8730147.1 murein biosynthesis integral membrane protein MurJ [Bradyrhizobium sp. LHD-71]